MRILLGIIAQPSYSGRVVAKLIEHNTWVSVGVQVEVAQMLSNDFGGFVGSCYE
jgi:hypothetical protein